MANAVDETAAHKAALMGEPIHQYGLDLWGFTMRQYEEWARCRKVWLSRQSTFPVFCVALPFLDALFALDMDAVERTGKPAGLMYTIMYGLGLALRLGENCVRDGNIYLSINEEERKLNAIIANQSGTPVEITPGRFKALRKTILWMQGDTVPDETLNDELLETSALLSERNAPPLKYSLLDLEASVALASGVRTKDVLDWTILEFETTRRAIDRSKRHLICGIGATNGCSWEGGNPYPSWCFDKEETTSSALIAQSQFGKSKKSKKE